MVRKYVPNFQPYFLELQLSSGFTPFKVENYNYSHLTKGNIISKIIKNKNSLCLSQKKKRAPKGQQEMYLSEEPL